MTRSSVLAIVQAGGAGNRMDVLTRERAKPALPVAGVFQLVDFPLTNLSHSGISEVWLSVQFHATSLEEQVANGRPWDLDRTRGGLRLMMPEEGTGGEEEEGFARGNADELYRLRDRIRETDPEVVIVMSADHVYRFDFGRLLARHREGDFECTAVTTEVDVADAADHAVLTVRENRVVEVDYKPDDPDHGTIAAEIIAYQPRVLVEVLEQLHRELTEQAEDGDTGLGDFGDHLLPRMVERGRVGALALEGYWRDLGQPHYYLRAHQELLDDDQGVLNVPGWPILTAQRPRPAARVRPEARVSRSLVSPGCDVAGEVTRSVLGPGVRIEAGACVTDSVIFEDCVVEADASVCAALVDTGCRIGAGARVGPAPGEQVDLDDPDQVALLGRDCVIAPGGVVHRGARLEPGSRADPE